MKRKEFEGNILVSISDEEVRLWVCKEGQNIFRFKAIGKVYESGQDITVLPNMKINNKKKGKVK